MDEAKCSISEDRSISTLRIYAFLDFFLHFYPSFPCNPLFPLPAYYSFFFLCASLSSSNRFLVSDTPFLNFLLGFDLKTWKLPMIFLGNQLKFPSFSVKNKQDMRPPHQHPLRCRSLRSILRFLRSAYLLSVSLVHLRSKT